MTAVTITKDLRSQFGPARDQHQRPTCIAFAVSDVHAAVNGFLDPLSCEYLYYYAVQRSGNNPNVGVSVNNICAAMSADGQPKESFWPYLVKLPADLALWAPPANPSPIFKRNHQLISGSFDKAMALVQAGVPSVMIMTISDAFFAPMSDHTIDSSEPVDPARVHAVVIAGAGKKSGTEFLLVRSSWGDDWGQDGYAWVSESYVTPRIRSLIQLMEAV